MTARIKGCCACPPIDFECSVCSDICKIVFQWDAQGADLDTSIVYDGRSSGFSCTNGNNPFFSTGDDTGQTEQEVHYVCLPKDSQTEIKMYCHWFNGSNIPEIKTVKITLDKCGEIAVKNLTVENTDSGCSGSPEKNDRNLKWNIFV